MIKFFKKLFVWIANRWVISVIGLIIVALLIWVFGPDVSFAGRAPLASEINRLLLIVLVVFLWGLMSLIAALRQRSTNQKVLDGLAAPVAAEDPSKIASREEVETLGERFREALATLKQARMGGRGSRRFLYQLPWYMMIGPPGSGKTTALANSGLKFPLAERYGKNAVRGVGGTRNCDWFFTDEAVLIDTAGRYTTQDSDEEVDRAAWQGFLQLLRKHRSRRPIEGIIIALSITDITGRDTTERTDHARAVRRRVTEIYDLLKIKAPVYVIFNKCDLIAGFTDFFGDLRPDEREQVWGVTFSLPESRQPNTALDAFPTDFAALIDRLTERVVSRLHHERDITRRGLLLSFPQQMALLGPAVQEFLGEAFGQSRFEETALLRGVYFTSATQQGTPVDRVLGAVAASFGLQRGQMPTFAGRGVSFFITCLLKDVMVSEAGLVTATGFYDRNRAWLLWGAYGGTAAITALLVFLMFGSFGANRGYVGEVDKAVDEFRGRHTTAMGDRGDAAQVLGTLDALHGLAQGYGGRNGENGPLMMRFGLFQGDKLGEATDDAYRRGLRTVLLPRLAERIEQQVADNISRPEVLYQALKVHLMLTTPERRDVDFLTLWIRSDFEARHPGAGNAELRETFARHLQALFEDDLGPVPENPSLVARARASLLRLPVASRVYGEIRDKILAENKETWTLASKVPERDLQFIRPRSGAPSFPAIPRLFTVEGYQTLFLKSRGGRIDEQVAETWVLGPDYEQTKATDERGNLEQKVADLYFVEYIRRWDELVKEVGLVRLHNTEQQANVLRALARPDSPLKSVLQAITEETTVAASTAEAAPRDPSLAERLRELQGRYEANLRKWFTSEARASQAADPAAKVDQHFAPLHRLLRAESGKPPPIDDTLTLLGEQQKLLEDLQAYQALGKGAIGQVAQTNDKLMTLSRRMESQAKFLPEPLKVVVADFARRGPDPGSARAQINEVWTTNVAPACQQALGDRYPFVKSSTTDTNLVDFARVLGPGGEIDKFAKEYITPYAQTSVRPWRWSEGSGQALGIPGGALRLFELADRIRQGFFAGGDAAPQVRFDIEPISLDTRAAQVMIEFGNQRLIYQHGPRRPQTMQWPPAQGSNAVLTFTPTGNVGQTIMISRSGPWALFHLLDVARIERSGGGDRLMVSFDVQGYQATFALRAESVVNPFSLPELEDFRCWDRL